MPTSDTRSWRQRLAAYQQPSAGRSILEIVITAAPLAAIWGAAWVAAHFGLWWLALLLAVPAALFLVRLFMIQHDCGHGSFFRTRWANDVLGHVLGVVTLTPYTDWRRSHAGHHATTGNLIIFLDDGSRFELKLQVVQLGSPGAVQRSRTDI